MTLHEEKDPRTDEDIKASNDGILKTVNDHCEKEMSTDDIWNSIFNYICSDADELPKRANAVILNKN